MRLRPRAGQVLRGVAGGVAMLTMLTLPIVCVRVRENSILDPPIAKSKMATDGDGGGGMRMRFGAHDGMMECMMDG